MLKKRFGEAQSSCEASALPCSPASSGPTRSSSSGSSSSSSSSIQSYISVTTTGLWLTWSTSARSTSFSTSSTPTSASAPSSPTRSHPASLTPGNKPGPIILTIITVPTRQPSWSARWATRTTLGSPEGEPEVWRGLEPGCKLILSTQACVALSPGCSTMVKTVTNGQICQTGHKLSKWSKIVKMVICG